MDILKFIKGKEIKITLFSTGRLKRPDEIKRTTAYEDIKQKRKERENVQDKLEGGTGVGKKTGTDI
jgi:hypothetical protein